MANQAKSSNMTLFVVVWIGQVISLIGSGLTEFAMAVWVFQHTGSTTKYALITVCVFLPGALLSPLAGALVDRWNRRWVMILSDSGAAFSTLILLFLLATGWFELWHIYPIVMMSSVFAAFQEPAYLAAIPLLVPQRHLGRANGMLQAGEALADILSPLLGAVLLVAIHIWGVILIDLSTCAFALLTLMYVRFPRSSSPVQRKLTAASLIRETGEGWKYVATRPGLLALLLFLALTNFTIGLVYVLMAPLVLGFADETTLGIIASMSGIGMLIGSVIMSVWGGPKPRVSSMLGFRLIQGILLCLVGVRSDVWLIAGAAFLFLLVDPFIEGSALVLLQQKVAPQIQGRVFALRTLFIHPAFLFAALVAGPLVDYLFDPWLMPDGLLAGSVGQLIGTGQGRGSGFLFMLMGVLTLLVTLAGYFYSPLRFLEQELPDAESV